MKLLTELVTLATLAVTVASCPTDGLDGSALTVLASESTEDFMALVWLGKSLLAELTSAFASLWIVLSWDCKPLMFELVRPLTEFSRLVRSVQYAGLLLPQPASAISATVATAAPATRRWRRGFAPGPARPVRGIFVVSLLRQRGGPTHPIRSRTGVRDAVIADLPIVGMPGGNHYYETWLSHHPDQVTSTAASQQDPLHVLSLVVHPVQVMRAFAAAPTVDIAIQDQRGTYAFEDSCTT